MAERNRTDEASSRPQAPVSNEAGIGQGTSIAQALRESEERLRAIVCTAVDAIITIDEHGAIVTFNPAAERTFGYRAEEVLGENVSLLMPEPFAAWHDGFLRRYIQTGEARMIGRRREVEGRRRDGTRFPGELAVSEIREGQSLFVAILRDVSDRKELQAELLRSAEEVQLSIGEELHDDVQQQMTGLGLMAQSLADALLDSPELPPTLRHLQHLAVRIARGIDEANRHIHFLSRGLIPVEVDAHGLQAALQDLASRACGTYPVACHFEQEQPAQVADSFVATHLYRIAQEALNNALKHSGADQIEIRLQQTRGELTLEVLDNGTGIEPQSKSARTVETEGRGLRIMAHRAGLIGASICVLRGERGGTVVRCNLNTMGGARQGERPTAEHESPGSQDPHRG